MWNSDLAFTRTPETRGSHGPWIWLWLRNRFFLRASNEEQQVTVRWASYTEIHMYYIIRRASFPISIASNDFSSRGASHPLNPIAGRQTSSQSRSNATAFQGGKKKKGPRRTGEREVFRFNLSHARILVYESTAPCSDLDALPLSLYGSFAWFNGVTTPVPLGFLSRAVGRQVTVTIIRWMHGQLNGNISSLSRGENAICNRGESYWSRQSLESIWFITCITRGNRLMEFWPALCTLTGCTRA